jgi:hypothetical protein
MENLGIFYDHLVYFSTIENILCPFGIFCGHLVYFYPFWYFVPRKIWQFVSETSYRVNAQLCQLNKMINTGREIFDLKNEIRLTNPAPSTSLDPPNESSKHLFESIMVFVGSMKMTAG